MAEEVPLSTRPELIVPDGTEQLGVLKDGVWRRITLSNLVDLESGGGGGGGGGGATDAASISYAGGGRLDPGTVEGALDTVGNWVATDIPFTPTGTVAASNVQAAIAEIAAEAAGGGGLTQEEIVDLVHDSIVAGTNVTVTKDDGADTLTIASTGGGKTDEELRDFIRDLLVEGTNITITEDDVGNTLTIDAAGGGGGGGAGYQLATVVVTKSGSTYTATCQNTAHGTSGVISQSTTGATVLQAAIDHVSNYVGNTGHQGGDLFIDAPVVSVATKVNGRAVDVASGGDTATTVWPIHIRGRGALPRPSAVATTDGGITGTVIRWSGAGVPTGNGSVLDLGDDCHGYIVSDLAIDGNAIAAKCAVSAGRKIEWRNVQFRQPRPQPFTSSTGVTPLSPDTAAVNAAGIGLLVTNGVDGSSDRYVQQRVFNCDFIGNSGGIALVVKNTQSGSGCTDGRIWNLQMNGCNDGGAYINEGGWGWAQGHLTMNNGGGNRNWGIWIDAGFFHLSTVYVDIVGLGPNIRCSNNSYTITNCFLISNGKQAASTYPIIHTGSSKGTITANLWGGDTKASRFIEGSGIGPVVVGNWGPSQSLGAGTNRIVPSSFTRAANNYED